jgi:flavin-binding protein dodecin
MAKKSKSTESGVCRVTEIIGTGSVSREAAAKNAVDAARSRRASPKSASST